MNTAPVAVNDTGSGNEDTPITGNVLTNDTDAQNNTLTAALVAGPAHGTVTLLNAGGYTYTPTANYNGADSFTYRANDGTVRLEHGTVNLTIAAGQRCAGGGGRQRPTSNTGHDGDG